MGKYLLETGTDRLLAESGGFLLVEHLPDDTDAITVGEYGLIIAPYTITDTGQISALPLGVESATLSDVGAVSITEEFAGVDALTITDDGVVLASWVELDAFGVTETEFATASAVDVEPITLSEDGTVEVGDDTAKTDADAFVMSEIEALLASVSEADTLVLSEASLREPPDEPVVVPEPEVFATVRWEPQPETQPSTEDEEIAMALAAYVYW